jgi:pimeloyl-ACP methyl ester carboxylesterase
MSRTDATPATPGSLLDALPYTDRGRGDALVLLHGFPLDRRMWDAQVERLSDHYRVIAPDLRGFGRSVRHDPFTIESLADDIHLFLEQLMACPCVLAGLSMGGYVALAYAKKYQSDLRGLILVDTKAAGDTAEGRQGREKMIELVRLSGAQAVSEQMLPKMLAPGTLQSRPDVVKNMRTMMEACSPKTIEHALAAMRDRPDRTGELPAIKVPALVVVGDADAITPPDEAEVTAKAIPSAKLETIRGAGHMSPMEQPEQVNRAIERFMAGL